MKKIFYIAFLILATSILLAHEVIPHHDHDGEIHFDFHDCEIDYCYLPVEEEKDHDKTGCCALFDLFVLLPSHQHHQFGSSGSDNYWGNNHVFISTSSLNPENWLLNLNLILGFCLFKDSHYRSFEGWSQSLRAPPFS